MQINVQYQQFLVGEIQCTFDILENSISTKVSPPAVMIYFHPNVVSLASLGSS